VGADRKAGRVYGGNADLAFAMMRSIEESVKNRQGGLKLFSVLIFWLLLDQAKSNSHPAAIERACIFN
jgi:hypothetical protein